MSKNVQAVPTFVMKDSVAIYDKIEILNCLNEHFISSGSLFDSDCSFSVKPYTDALAYTGQCFNFAPFAVQKVHKALKTLDPRKPPGPDLIDPYFLKLAADFIAEPLAFLFNLAVENKEIPRIWKTSFILPLLKGSDPAFLNNYKPTSNLSVKILEGPVSDQLKEFLYTNAILSAYQSGFRGKKHSTISAAMKVVNDISVALDNKHHCASLFINLSKAFDKANHDILKCRLFNIGLLEQAVAWFSNYLSNKSQCIKYDSLCSETVTIYKGISQGSALGPL